MRMKPRTDEENRRRAWVYKYEERTDMTLPNAAAFGIELSSHILDAIDEALGDVLVKEQKAGPNRDRGRHPPCLRRPFPKHRDISKLTDKERYAIY